MRQPVAPVSRFLFLLTNEKIIYWVSPLLIALMLMMIYYLFIERILFLRLGTARAIEILYQRFYRLGRPLAGAYTHAETALEFKSKLIRTVEELSQHSKNFASLKEIQSQAQHLTELYQLSLFSNSSLQRRDALLAFNLWRKLRRTLYLTRIKVALWNQKEWVRNKMMQPSYKSS